MIANLIAWLTDPAHHGDILTRTLEHLQYSLVATLLAALVAIPLGLWGAVRFHAPLIPFVALLAAVGITALAPLARSARR